MPSRRTTPGTQYIPLRLRSESYADEVRRLPATYRAALDRDGSAFSAAIASVLGSDAWYVGSGGAYAVARYAAELHNRATGHVAQAVTSLDFITSEVRPCSSVVLISAGARHPDTAAAAQVASRRGVDRTLLVTEKHLADLPISLRSSAIEVVSIPRDGEPDGFLATNSVLNMVVAFARAHGIDGMPRVLPFLRKWRPVTSIQPGVDLLVLAGGGLWGPAYDLEARLRESGLAAVQLADYRNFAHGRHFGLSQNTQSTRIIALSNQNLFRLAEQTLHRLPDDVPIIRLHSDNREAVAAIDLFAATIQLFGDIASAADFDPARPKVPSFGRELYRLDSRRVVDNETRNPAVDRKISAAQLSLTDDSVRNRFDNALRSWIESTAALPLGGVVMDYDGTVVNTTERFALPGIEVRTQIIRLLEHGLLLGFASGRGRSLAEGLGRWIPEEWHSRVHLGMYHGAVRALLSDSLAEIETLDDATFLADKSDLIRQLEEVAVEFDCVVTARSHQISVRARTGGVRHWSALQNAVFEAVSRHRADTERAKIAVSGHSIDLISAATSKCAMADDVESRAGMRTLNIGDRGQVLGNDYELLSMHSATLSVDRVSGDPSRCWRLGDQSTQGADLLSRYLRAVRRARSRRIHFRWAIDE